jgi:putative ABC transport system permease protein
MKRDVEWLGEWPRLVKYAVRSLSRTPAFTAAAVLTLSVGIGATTAICSVVNAILLQPLPLRDADRLVRIVERERPRNMPSVNYREYLDWQSRTTTLSGLATAAFNPNVVMSAPTGLVRVTAGQVSSNYFEILGARALLGRALVSADAGDPDVMVLGYYAWQRHFGSNPEAVGSLVQFRSGSLAGRSLTVIGVMPESMETIGAPMDVYVPIAAVPNAGTTGLTQLIGRLRAGTALAAAVDEANVIGAAVLAGDALWRHAARWLDVHRSGGGVCRDRRARFVFAGAARHATRPDGGFADRVGRSRSTATSNAVLTATREQVALWAPAPRSARGRALV